MKTFLDFEDFKELLPEFYEWASPVLKDNEHVLCGSTLSCYQIKFMSSKYTYHFAITTKSIGATAIPNDGGGYETLVSSVSKSYTKQSFSDIMDAIVRLESGG